MSATPVETSIESNRSAIGQRAAAHIGLLLREHVRNDTVVNGPDYYRLITGEPHPLGNLVTFPDREAEAHFPEAIAPLIKATFPSAVLFPQGVSASTQQAVLAAGYVDAGAMPAMAVDIVRLQVTTLPEGYDFVRVLDGDAWEKTLATGYGLPLKVAQLFAPSLIKPDPADDAELQFLAIQRAGRIVATSLLYLADGLAGVYCVATVPEERGKGLGAHVTAEALRIAGRLGYHVGILQSSQAGHNVYVRLGFQDVGTVPLYVRVPA